MKCLAGQEANSRNPETAVHSPREHVRIVRPGEGLLELLQLEAGKGRPVATLLSLGREVVGLGFALGAGWRRSRMRALFLGSSDFFRGDAHLSGLKGRCRRRLLMRLRVRLLAHLLAHLSHLTRAACAARRTRLRDGLLAASSRRLICVGK